MTVTRWMLSVLLAIGLGGCELVESGLEPRGSCSRFNAPEDQFRLAVAERDVLMSLGSSAELTLTTTWLNDQLRRVPIDCTVTWSVSDEGVVEVVDRGLLIARGTGVATVTANVSGTGGAKSDSVIVGVVPLVTEEEPNNGPPFANVMVDGDERIGISDYSGDEDWFAGDLAPGTSAQFTLRPSISLETPRWSWTYSGSVRDADGRYLVGANRTFTNTGETTVRFYLRVTGSGDVPYSVRFDVM